MGKAEANMLSKEEFSSLEAKNIKKTLVPKSSTSDWTLFLL